MSVGLLNHESISMKIRMTLPEKKPLTILYPKCPLHLKYVLTLPWEIRRVAEWYGDISYTSWVMADFDFLMKFANFCCHGNKGGSNKNLNDSVWLAYRKTLSSVQKSGTYLKCKLSYGEFCVKKFPNFCYHGNRGCLTQISLTQLNLPTPNTFYLVQDTWWYLLYKLSNFRFSVDICQFLLLWQQGWV